MTLIAPEFRALLLLVATSNLYGCAVFSGAVLGRRDLLAARFSVGKFYLLMGWVPAAFAALGLVLDVRYVLLFFVAGAAGIVGELLVSVWYRHFFAEPIWTYSFRSVLQGYTSTLNFFPWAVGALLFCEARRLMGGGATIGAEFVESVRISAVALVLGMVLSLALRRFTSARTRRFSRSAFAVFCIPIATTAVALAAFVSPGYLIFMMGFSVVGFLTEYGYGRTMAVFFERGLWTYNHWPIDGGHTSFVTLPLWALGGLYFHFIATALGL